MGRVVWMALISACLMGSLIDSAIIRPFRTTTPAPTTSRYYPVIKAATRTPISRYYANGKVIPVIPATKYYANGKVITVNKEKRRKGYRPTSSRCCNIGEKAAKRTLTCNAERISEIFRHVTDRERARLIYNRPPKFGYPRISERLSKKLHKCLVAFPKYFEKCCKYREQFFTSMAKCKKRPRKERRQCRESVRQQYNSPSSEKRRSKSQKKRRQRRPRRIIRRENSGRGQKGEM